MELDDLALFVQVVETGGMSGAARRSGRSQPTVSRAVQRLERELGMALLRRTEAGVVEVLPAGKRVLAAAQRILAEGQALLEDLASEAREIRGLLQIAASTVPGEYLVPRLLSGFRPQYPHIATTVLVSDTAQVLACLARREHDVGFLGAPAEGNRFTLVPVGEDRIVLAVPAGHPFAGRSAVAFAEVRKEHLVLREQGSGTMASLNQQLARHDQRLPVDQATVLGSTHAQLAAIGAGVGIGFVSSWVAAGRGDVVVVPVDGLDIRRTLYLSYEPERLTAPPVRAFVEYVRAWAHEQAKGYT